jgi:hypothetical protein
VRAEHRYESLNRESIELELRMRDGHAYFARAEVLSFCKSRKYALNPLNVANAVAGLPFIGCRQSINRCRKSSCATACSANYRVFEIIKRLVESRPFGTDLIEHFRNNLKPKNSGESFAVSELRQKWHFLREAIEATLNSPDMKRQRRPFHITSEYFKRATNPSRLVAIIAEGEALPGH